ncbi:MAG: extracellular solute-binding protein [bacterium]|nr:extracellular solute-binding protein [bacterium]
MSVKKTILILLGILAVLALVVVGIVKFFFGGFGATTITYWGLWEPDVVYTSVIADYQKLHPNVTINYKKQSQIQYRDRLSVALKSNTPPDIFRFHNTWLPMLKTNLSPVPNNVYDPASFKSIFYPVAQKDLFAGANYYGIPLEIDTLVLFVNEDIFTQAGAQVPTSWPQEFLDTARRLTVRNNGRIERAGAAMGNAGNVTHWPDILALLMLQSGVDLKNPTGGLAEEALNYYTGFQNLDQIWDETMDESKLAFSKGNLAMYFGYSWDYFDLKAMNQNLNFKVVPVPQLPDKTVNYASYWVEGVAQNSPNKTAAWEFLKFISSKEELAKLYEAEAKYRGFGEPYGRTDMANLLISDPTVGIVINQAKTAQSWYLASLTWDGPTGINTKLSNYFADAINTAKTGNDAKSALATLSLGVNQVLSTYGLATPIPAK